MHHLRGPLRLPPRWRRHNALPNALCILDTLGVYEKIRSRGFEYTNLHFYTDKPLDFYEFGDREKYQYNALRIYRHELIDALLAAIKEMGIPVEYGKKFT
jgi:2-polyprenyl-6-methoxyphenol hydroxylase-like FAD-dependent oxidoreductase